MAKYVFIPCCKKQNLGPLPAEGLYASGLFKKSLAHARTLTTDDKIFILSTNYGLLKLTDVISNYDLSSPVGGWKTWSVKVEAAIKGFTVSGDELVFLSGQNYYKYLSFTSGIVVTYPLKGLSIGQRMAYLK